MVKAILSFLFIFSISFVGFMQCERILLKGKVVDKLQPRSFYNLMVFNKTTGKGVFGRPNGNFSAYVSKGDRIILSIKNYPKYEFIVEPDSNCQFLVHKEIERLPQELEEVIIRPLKTVTPSPFSAAVFMAFIISLASSMASGEGVKTSLASAICFG